MFTGSFQVNIKGSACGVMAAVSQPRPLLKRKKAMRPGSLDLEELREGLKPGPASLAELYAWPENAFQVLQTNDASCLRLLEQNFLAGGSLISHYSGKGTLESAFCDVGNYVREKFDSLRGFSQPRFQCCSACDISAVCRKLLLGHGQDSAPNHVFGDILQRVPEQTPPLRDMSFADLQSILKDRGSTLYTASSVAYCYRHNRPCCLWHGLNLPGKPEERSGLLISGAGFCCTDWSPRRMGKRPGAKGLTAPVFMHWIAENRALKPDLLFWENSSSFDPNVLTEALGEEYLHVCTELGPDVLGWPHLRPRIFGVAVLRSTCSFTGSTDEFLSWFLRRVVLDADIFFQAPEPEVQSMMQELAARRGHGQVEHPSLNMAVTPSSFAALQEYRKLRASRAGLQTGAFLCDLEQNPGYASCGAFLPSCPTHSTIFSLNRDRILSGKETLAAMGFQY